MAQFQVQDDDEIILVEFAPVTGVRAVSRSTASPANIAERSKEAIDDALKKMRGMAKKTVKAIREIPPTERPNTISVSFGLKLSAEGGAVLAKAGLEAGINVTMTWNRVIPAPAKSKRK